MLFASEAKRDAFYRRTRRTLPGVYYTVPKSKTARAVVEDMSVEKGRLGFGLQPHPDATGREVWVRSRLLDGWVLMWRHIRERNEAGRITESRHYTAIPPDHTLRAVAKKPRPRG